MQDEKRCEFKLTFEGEDWDDEWKMILRTTEPKTEEEIKSLISYYAEVNDRNSEDYSPCDILDDICEEKGWEWEDLDYQELRITEW